MEKIKLPLNIKIFGGIFIIGLLISLCTGVYNSLSGFYNQTVDYKLEYKALEQNQVTTYDNYYLAYMEKSNVADINKETFLNVTNIIMSARTDGQQIAWKWVHENQQIPYSEFTSFYKDLSAFVESRFKENNVIERSKQDVAKKHNILITTFPGVIYNYFIHIPSLEYKKGFISDETKELFKE